MPLIGSKVCKNGAKFYIFGEDICSPWMRPCVRAIKHRVGVRKRGIHVLAKLYQSIKQPTFFISYPMLTKSLRCQEVCLSCGALFGGSDSAIVWIYHLKLYPYWIIGLTISCQVFKKMEDTLLWIPGHNRMTLPVGYPIVTDFCTSSTGNKPSPRGWCTQCVAWISSMRRRG